MVEANYSEQPTQEPAVGIRVVGTFGAILMGGAVTLTFLQVVLRTFFNEPQTWVEELSRYIFVWVVFVGAAIGVYHDNHIRLDLVDGFLRRRALSVLNVLRTLAEIAAMGLLLCSGVLVAWRNRNSGFYTIPDLPQVVFYLSVPVCAALTIWFLVRRLSDAKRSP
jgi:TRAP-type C4-dicarboxylate transport system permease small subunit